MDCIFYKNSIVGASMYSWLFGLIDSGRCIENKTYYTDASPHPTAAFDSRMKNSDDISSIGLYLGHAFGDKVPPTLRSKAVWAKLHSQHGSSEAFCDWLESLLNEKYLDPKENPSWRTKLEARIVWSIRDAERLSR